MDKTNTSREENIARAKYLLDNIGENDFLLLVADRNSKMEVIMSALINTMLYFAAYTLKCLPASVAEEMTGPIYQILHEARQAEHVERHVHGWKLMVDKPADFNNVVSIYDKKTKH